MYEPDDKIDLSEVRYYLQKLKKKGKKVSIKT